ncbi:DUF6177 family protein [Actinoplanes sp. NPDC051346]|uniref:DUF6177 family protein n=1 Tax=Actinoplanes sp. NPDC051346 TaxID=3155048 RepID=UPI0034437866
MGDVHGGDLPASPGEPEGVIAVAAAQVQGRTGSYPHRRRAPDGQSGRPLGWDGAAFVPLDPSGLAPHFTNGPQAPAWHLTITLQVRHPVSERLLLGGALEELFTQLTERPPAGWGTAEPATQPWDRHTLTDLCRERAPRRTWLCAVGDGAPALAAMVISRPGESVLETIRCTVVYTEPVEAHALTDTARNLSAAYDIRQLLVQQAPGQTDTTHASHWTGLSTHWPSSPAPKQSPDAPRRTWATSARSPPPGSDPGPATRTGTPYTATAKTPPKAGTAWNRSLPT